MNGAATPTDQPHPAAPHPTVPDQAPLRAAALRPEHIKAALTHPRGRFRRVAVVESAGSTNTDLAANAADHHQHWPDLSVLIANAQPAGKGRLGRTWEVPAGSAMISSVFVRPGEQARQIKVNPATPAPEFALTGYGWLSILAGVALCETLRSLTGVPAELKWPNDVVVRGRKIAGILAQVVPVAVAGPRATWGPGVVVGTGVNVSLQEHQLPTERATSLLVEGASIAGPDLNGAESQDRDAADQLDRNVLLTAFLNRFAALYQGFVAAGGDAQQPLAGSSGFPKNVEQGSSLLALAEQNMSTLGQDVRVELPGGVVLHGTATALRFDGALLVRDNAGTVHAVSAGDVIHLRRTGLDGTVHYA